ncbi:MAG: translation initiation factor IF-2 [Clostridia bacterium]|nr:translation initiation factor IF-2 [Clostridia bacterium]
MSTLVKIRISDIAKDFGVSNKVIMGILTEHNLPPKSPAKVLDSNELNIVFNALTAKNQVNDLEAALKKTAAPETKAEPAAEQPKVEEKRAEEKPVRAEAPAANAPKAPQQNSQNSSRPQGNQNGGNNQQQPRPASQDNRNAQPHSGNNNNRPQQNQQANQQRKPERRYVDTRGSSVDMSKYDEKLDRLAGDKDVNAGETGKQKIKKSADRKTQSFGNKRRAEEQEKMRRLQKEVQKKAPVKVSIPDEISVGELASRLKKTASEVIKVLMKMGVMAAVSEVIDFDTASLVAMEFGAKIEREVHLTVEERLFDEREDSEEDLQLRTPVVVVMGHVDHGKTSLLDAVRKTSVASGEAGGITQHIGAYQVDVDGRLITFLDTPGHAAFTSMRARGASVTDVAILVVAADDGIMPQTIEAINHAKAANVPIIVAVNKCDKHTADPDHVIQQLMEYDLVPEEFGGDTIVARISALTGMGIPELLEMVLLVSDMRELKANPDRPAVGTVIEAKLDKNRGPVATLLVQNGTLKTGDLIIAGKAIGHIRAMTNDKGMRIGNAGPSVPVEVIGLDETPGAGEKFHVIKDERLARELVVERKQQERDANVSAAQSMTLADLFTHLKEGSLKDLNIVLKADVQGSVEAIKKSLEELSNEEVRVKIIHGGVGAVNENDIMLASASNAIVIGFNVRPDINTRNSAEQKGIDIRLHRVIYECIDEVKSAIKGMLAPKFKEDLLGTAEVRQVFKVTGVGAIAGCMVKDGKVQRAAKVRIVRDGIVIHEGEISSLRRFKDDVKEVATGFECGIGIERYTDVKVGDIIENFIMVQI